MKSVSVQPLSGSNKDEIVYKAVVFDFGNVLCRVNRNAFSEALAAYCPHDPTSIGKMLWGGRLETEFETGKLDSTGYFKLVSEKINAYPGLTYERFCSLFMLILEPNPDGVEALRYVHARGLRTFILSNISFLHSTWIFNHETLATIPELHILSYKVGAMKPDPRIWNRMLQYSGLPAAECLYVDDIQAYCDAARALGFAAIKYDFRSQNLSRELQTVL